MPDSTHPPVRPAGDNNYDDNDDDNDDDYDDDDGDDNYDDDQHVLCK